MLTININGLTLCHKGSDGVSHNTLPDVCKTPPFGIPVAYENEAYSADLVKGTVSVSADGGNMIANMGSQFARSVFDEPGSMGGVISGTNKAETDWISHSFDVFFEGRPACRLTDKLFMNHGNTANMAGLMQAALPPIPEMDATTNAPLVPEQDKIASDPSDDDDEKDSPHSMPCIVILVHGVNDVGEAYQNQDTGICKGLNTRLGRSDLQPHTWDSGKFMITDVAGKVASSPVIPFYWGYKPVDKTTFVADQRRYRNEVKDLHGKQNNADLPYDTYLESDDKKIGTHAGEHIDNLNNWLDKNCADTRGGGTFANATTSIPDMFGPGAQGFALDVIGTISRSKLNEGDWSHPIYRNPHRIYQAYAARRLADLILAIRRNPISEKDTINIVAHSQGTIITMLANMWVKAEDGTPADCVILNHSPYSLENRWLENAQPGNQQRDHARQQTLANFCKLMAENTQYNEGKPHEGNYIEQLYQSNCLSSEGKTDWEQETFSRNNFGLVYNYFCPNDKVVSMYPVQGFGWRGIPDKIARHTGDNLRQRVFCKDEFVGSKTGYHFITEANRQALQEGYSKPKPNDPNVPAQDANYLFTDVTINAPLLPESFVFELQGQDSDYRMPIEGNDRDISRAAMMEDNVIEEITDVPDTREYQMLDINQQLNTHQLSEISSLYNIEAISGRKIEHYTANYIRTEKLEIQRRMTEEEMQEALKTNSSYSQHSSIVCSPVVPEMAMSYDLAIGQCKAFENETLWKELLNRADWRRPENKDDGTKSYFTEGILPDKFKKMMNRPETGKQPMPTGDHGVVNDYGPRQKVVSGNGRNMENQVVKITQWDMPDPLEEALL